MAGRSLSIVIPAFNEERRLPATIRTLHRFLSEGGYDGEILVVDDGSRDGTLASARELHADIPTLRVIALPANRGKGYAVREGMLAARKEAILFTDADLSTPIEDVERLWPLFDRGSAVVIASRHVPSASSLVRQSARRRLMGRVFNLLLGLLGVRGFQDTQCGFKLFRSDVARRLFDPLRTPGFAFDVEILLRARSLGLRVSEVPVRWIQSDESQVKPLRDAARMLLDVLRIRTRLR